MRNQILILAVGVAFVAIIVGIGASGVTFTKQDAAPATGLSEMQQRVVENYRARRPTFGYMNGDYGFNGGVYSCPYSNGSSFAIGDFNDDGHEDFAVILRVREGPSHLVVFNGPLVSDAQEPAYEADINNLGFFVSPAINPNRPHAEVCALGPDASPGFSLAPKGRTYVLEWTLVPG